MNSTPAHPGATALLAAALLALTPGAAHADPPVPGPACGHQTIDRTAPVVSSGDVLVHAPLGTVFALQTDVAAWPSWREDVAFVRPLDDGPLRAGSRFRWSTGGITVTSTVRALHHGRCVLWGGPANGIDGIHLWTFTRTGTGTLVHTEESWDGAPVRQDVAGAQAALDASLASWRDALKETAEGWAGAARPTG